MMGDDGKRESNDLDITLLVAGVYASGPGVAAARDDKEGRDKETPSAHVTRVRLVNRLPPSLTRRATGNVRVHECVRSTQLWAGSVCAHACAHAAEAGARLSVRYTPASTACHTAHRALHVTSQHVRRAAG